MKLSPKLIPATIITAIASFWVWLAISDVRDNAFPEPTEVSGGRNG